MAKINMPSHANREKGTGHATWLCSACRGGSVSAALATVQAALVCAPSPSRPSPCQCSCLSKPNDPAIPLLGSGPGKNMIQKDTCTPVFAAPPFPMSITKTWKQTKCPSTEECIKKTWYIYATEYFTQPLKRMK